MHTVERGAYSLLKLSCSSIDGGLSGNLSSLVLQRGYDPELDPLMEGSLGLGEVVIMGVDAHALQGHSISAFINGEPMSPFSIYFDPFTSVLKFMFGNTARSSGMTMDRLSAQKRTANETRMDSNDIHSPIPLPSVSRFFVLRL